MTEEPPLGLTLSNKFNFLDNPAGFTGDKPFDKGPVWDFGVAMTKLIENSQDKSSIYEDRLGLQSIDPGTSTPSEGPICSPEDAQTPASPDPQTLKSLDLDAPLPVQNKIFSGKTLSLRNVLEKAGEGKGEAISILTSVLEERLGLQLDQLNLDQSFVSEEGNIVAILTQMKHGDELGKQQAAKSLVTLIEQEFNKGDCDAKTIKFLKGLIAAAGILKSREFALEFIKVLKEDSKLNLLYNKKNAPQIPNWHIFQGAIAELRSEENSPNENSSVALRIGGSSGGKNSSGLENALATNAPSFMASSRIGIAGLIEQSLFQNIRGSGESEKYLSGQTSRTLGRRLADLAESAQAGELSVKQLHQSIRLAVLAASTVANREFVSVESGFGGLQKTASRIAADILNRLKSTEGLSPAGSETVDKGLRSASAFSPHQAPVLLPDQQGSRDRHPSLVQNRDLGASLEIFAGESPVVVSGNGVSPLITQAAAILQGIPFQALAKGTTSLGLEPHFGHPSYFVEGPTPEAEAHSQGQSHSSHQEQSQGDDQSQSAYA